MVNCALLLNCPTVRYHARRTALKSDEVQETERRNHPDIPLAFGSRRPKACLGVRMNRPNNWEGTGPRNREEPIDEALEATGVVHILRAMHSRKEESLRS